MGMEFVLLPRPYWAAAENTASARLYVCTHEVTVQEFERFITATGFATDAEAEGEGGRGWKFSKRGFDELRSGQTWRQWGESQSPRHPVVNVSRDDAQAFCRWLSRQDGHAYRLPTVAEWQAACRGKGAELPANADPRLTANACDSALRALVDVPWAERWDDGFPFVAPVGAFRPNGHGLYDMYGNVAEWCTPDLIPGTHFSARPAGCYFIAPEEGGAGIFAMPDGLSRDDAETWDEAVHPWGWTWAFIGGTFRATYGRQFRR